MFRTKVLASIDALNVAQLRLKKQLREISSIADDLISLQGEIGERLNPEEEEQSLGFDEFLDFSFIELMETLERMLQELQDHCENLSAIEFGEF